MSDKKTILIVDDQEDARVFVESALCEMGDFNIVTAPDGQSGLQKAKESTPDLIVMDVMMPKTDGFNAFHAMRKVEHLAKTPIIMLTGVSEQTGIAFSEKDMGEFLGAEPFAFLDKPVDPEVLQQTARDALGM